MITSPTTLKELYDSIEGEKVSYKVWLKKMNRFVNENKRTVNKVGRSLGIEPARPVSDFIAYDGEGWDNKFVLLANSLGERISNPEGLSSRECLEFLTARYSFTSKRVFFSFGYDINHILRDLPDDVLRDLLSGRIVNWETFNIQYIPGKIFKVNGYTYYDTFGFFQTSFINVVRNMLGEDHVTDLLLEGKMGRGNFEEWDFDKIVEYNDLEVTLLVEIMEKLRKAFHDINVRLTEWYGPGAVAKYWYKENRVYPRDILTAPVAMALNSAYYGGRFEQIKLGRIQNVWEYDIHSAYPAVMADMPYFLDWKKVQKYKDNPYSIWHVSFDLREDYKNDPKNHAFLPLPVRSRDGRICFPLVGRGWYWQREIALVLRFFPTAKITFHEGYIANTDGTPFGWVRNLYYYRQQLKAAGNLSQYAIKVGLNSLYGKTAQRVGHNQFFSLAWAGYITSTTRAKLAEATYENGAESIIGFATDALFTNKPYSSLPIDKELGSWDEQHFARGTFFQSGVYRLETASGEITDRYRGAPLRRGIDDIIQQLNENPREYPVIKVGRFISHLLALRATSAYGPYRLRFVQVQHRLNFDAPYKRHYTDFIERIDDNGRIISDYSRLLRQPINSLPKIYVDDWNPFLWNDLLWDNLKFTNTESYPQPMKDKVGIQLVDESVIAGTEGGYDEVSDLDTLPILEDESV